MKRRALLAAFGAATAGAAGCASLPLSGSGTDPEDTTTATAERWGDDPPCPTFHDGADRTVCAGEFPVGDHVGEDAVLHPDGAGLVLDGDDGSVPTLAFELRSHDGERLAFNPNDWTLARFEDPGWTEVATGPPYDPLTELPPSETYTWSLATQQHPTPGGGNYHPIVADLSPGRYALSVVVGVGEDPTAGDRVECNGLFGVTRA